MTKIFGDFEAAEFWKQSDYANEVYVDVAPNKNAIESAQGKLGYSLPKSYIELANYQNGGIPKKRCHRVASPTSWAKDHIAISGIFSIGDKKPKSLCGEFGNHLWLEEWGYPAIGVYFADCPSAGHDMLCLDYSACGANGEPRVVHVDQEFDYKITFVARSFEAFIRGLEGSDAFGD